MTPAERRAEFARLMALESDLETTSLAGDLNRCVPCRKCGECIMCGGCACDAPEPEGEP